MRRSIAAFVILAAAGAPAASAGAYIAAASHPQLQARDGAWQLVHERGDDPIGSVVDVRAVGDLMFARGVAASIAGRGYDYPLRAVRPLLRGDIVVGNLESPLTTGLPSRPGPYRFAASPRVAAALGATGFTALSLANNHALDAGPAGLAHSAEALRRAGIAPLGVGAGTPAASKPVYVTVRGVSVALLAFNDVADPEDGDSESATWGRAWLTAAALAAVASAGAESDAVVVLVHWGQEYEPRPSTRQRTWARSLVEAGADVVLGSHPHVLQPLEPLKASDGRTALVAYSLGNFVFDQDFSGATQRGAVLRLTLDARGVAGVWFAPVIMRDAQVRLAQANGPDGRAVAAALRP